MPEAPLRVQLAIQGGGAKICSLLAAAESIEQLIEGGELEVTRLAGTSAGAIVACLIGGAIPIGEVRVRLQNLEAKEFQRLFPGLSKARLFTRFIRGRPMWDTRPLRDLLTEFFDERRLATLGDIKNKTGRDVFITATDIINERRIDYHEQTDPIVNGLISSCALPYVFSTYRNIGATLVDGGICENLPIEVLKAGEAQFGQVIGISLSTTKPRLAPSNLIEFSLALLNTAINNSMIRAKESIGMKRVFTIHTDIDTLEFKRAMREGLGLDHFGRINAETKAFFTTLEMVRQPGGDQGLLVGDPWQGADVDTMRKLGRIYLAQHEPTRIFYTRLALIVTVNSLYPPESPRHSLPDLIEQQLEFRPAEGAIYCHRLVVGSKTATGFPGRLSCTVVNARGEEHRSEVVPSLSAESEASKGGVAREILVFFDPPLQVGEDPGAPYTILMRDLLSGGLAGLDEKGVDEVGTSAPRAAGPVPQIDLVLLIPQSYSGCGKAKLEYPGTHSYQGRSMTDDELSIYNVPEGFRALGWTGRNVPAKVYFATALVVPHDPVR